MSGLADFEVERYQLTRYRTLTVYQDPDPGSPSDEQDEGAFLIAGHRDFWVPFPGTGNDRDPGRAPNPENVAAWVERGTHWAFPIEAYIHSGVRLAFASEGNFPDRRWDVSNPVGYIFCAKAEWRQRKSAEKYAAGMLKRWNWYLEGSVYGFMIEGAGGDEDSCWGFEGDADPWTNGMADNLSDKDRRRLARVHPQPKRRKGAA